MSRRLLIILGDQLFDYKNHYGHLKADVVFMAEDEGLCSHERYHQLKIYLFLSAMRAYRDQIPKSIKLSYHELEESGDFFAKLVKCIKAFDIQEVVSFEVEDEFFETKLRNFFQKHRIPWKTFASPGFLTSREEFLAYLNKVKRPFMKTFYESQRKRLSILMTKDGKPEGGQFSFDEENRKRLPKDLTVPSHFSPESSEVSEEVKQIVKRRFSHHPGSLEKIWFPVTRKGALAQLKLFVESRLESFGPYEDAFDPREPFLFHSVLSPFLNLGLLTPSEVVEEVLGSFGRRKKIGLASVEGYIRQIVGWREFVRGIYQNYRKKQEETNFFGQTRGLTASWYEGTTGIEPLDAVIRRTQTYGYAHHIERLMILSNLMLLSEIHPREVYRWFMEMFIDSADWVMGPNVYGMGQFSDGGIFATKPYICGSNYLLKMGRISKGPWCEVVDGLYWSFIEKHKDFYLRNPRVSVMVKALDRMDPARLRKLKKLANEFRETKTSTLP